MFSKTRNFGARFLTVAFGSVCVAFLVAIAVAEQKPDSSGGKSGAPGAAKADEKVDQLALAAARQEALEKDVTQGALRIVQPDGQVVECPLKHTDVQADVSGFIARVKVTQTFHNPTQGKIEAVYVFPLPHEAAVDDMTMVIGDRKIVGLIKRRAEARNIYQQALAAGQTAALLEQERPNIFTQSVGNIGPGQDVNIEISYVDVLRYDMGTYEFHFPMIVGPRYNPGAPIASPSETPTELQGKVSPPQPDTSRMPDASRISPPVLKPGYRNGNEVSLSVNLQAGVPIKNLKSTNHRAGIAQDKITQAEIKLAADDSIPNKDFVLRYDVVGEKPAMALLTHTGRYSGDAKALGEGYFLLMIQPREDERLTKSPPREVVFLVDVSGSMSGQPIGKAAHCMREMAKLCRPEKDTFQVITFAGATQKLFEKPVPVTDENVKLAVAASEAMKGGGGTEMLTGVKAAIDEPLDPQRVRIIVMLTDGYIGNEAQIIEHVGKHCGDQVRFWCIGIGQAPNMFLVDGVAKQGGGMGKKLGLNDDANSLAQEVMTRIQRAQLAKIKIDWGTLNVAETYPAKIPELWAGRPVILFGRYRGAGEAAINISGMVEGEPTTWPLQVKLPQQEAGHDVLAKTWARQKIEDLMQQTFYAGSPAVEEMVTALALDYKLMSQYTSFVAVDSKNAAETTEPSKPPRRMLVPVPLPEGTRWEGFFGDHDGDDVLEAGVQLRLFDAIAEEKSERLVRRRGAAVSGIAGNQWGAFGGGGFGGAPVNGPHPAMMTGLGRYARTVDEMQPMGQINRYRFDAGAVSDFNGLALGASNFEYEARKSVSHPRSLSMRGLQRGGWSIAADKTKLPVAAALGKEISEELSSKDAKAAEVAQRIEIGAGATQQALHGGGETFVKAATEALQAAKDAQQKDQLDTARALFTRAYFLDAAAANFGASGGNVAAEALGALQTIHAGQIKTWSKDMPALAKKLDLVIRDRSLDEALRDVAQAAGLSVKLLAGSLDDARSLAGEKELRVNYLDLRRATAAEALDWLLLPERMNWQANSDGIVVGTDRRRDGQSAWVYDVSLIALPDLAQPEKQEDWQKTVAAAQKEASDFSNLVRLVLGVKENDLSVAWFAPGQLLLIGTREQHEKADKLLADLADPKAKLTGELAALQKITAARAAKRTADVEKMAIAGAKLRTAAMHEAFGWQLLAAAAEGKVDLEALTELQIAWKQPETAELLKGAGRAMALRSLWIVSEASRALPDQAELAALAKSGRSACAQAATEAVAALEKKPDDAEAFAAVLYAAMALRDDAALAGKALPLLTASSGTDDALRPARTLAQALLAERKSTDATALMKLVETGVSGDDFTVLLAMACQRAGGDAWNTFRAAAQELVGKQPLSGHVVVLVNRLSQGQLPLVAAAH